MAQPTTRYKRKIGAGQFRTERLRVGVADIKADFGFLNGPGRRETAMTP